MCRGVLAECVALRIRLHMRDLGERKELVMIVRAGSNSETELVGFQMCLDAAAGSLLITEAGLMFLFQQSYNITEPDHPPCL